MLRADFPVKVLLRRIRQQYPAVYEALSIGSGRASLRMVMFGRYTSPAARVATRSQAAQVGRAVPRASRMGQVLTASLTGGSSAGVDHAGARVAQDVEL